MIRNAGIDSVLSPNDNKVNFCRIWSVTEFNYELSNSFVVRVESTKCDKIINENITKASNLLFMTQQDGKILTHDIT